MNNDGQTTCTIPSQTCGDGDPASIFSTGPLVPGVRLPLLMTAQEGRDLGELSAAARCGADEFLSIHGGVLFRGLPVESPSDFESFVKVFTQSMIAYEFGSTPRSQVHHQVYTSTEYPSDQHIPLHNEQAYTTEWPMKIWFYCGQPSEEGGYTPIADSREVLTRIPSHIRKRFIRKGVMYVRNYGNGLDVPWQKVFNTEDRAIVEQFCRKNGILFEWKPDGELRTRQIAQAVAVHPVTQEEVWFNQAHLFHVSNLEPDVREALLCAVSEDELPRHVYYGDGTSIETDVLNEIRDVYRCLAVQFSWQKGDVLMLDNMLAAHGRTPYKGNRQILVAMAEPSGALPECR
ncbi:TauD/TfdA family dioxygenase [Nitrospira sp. MA-1]|nr:TauD/TfdA family dioxygenase [Nitrospira sp. MA-1]